MLTFILCLIAVWLAAVIGYAVGTIVAASKRADEQDDAFYRETPIERESRQRMNDFHHNLFHQ